MSLTDKALLESAELYSRLHLLEKALPFDRMGTVVRGLGQHLAEAAAFSRVSLLPGRDGVAVTVPWDGHVVADAGEPDGSAIATVQARQTQRREDVLADCYLEIGARSPRDIAISAFGARRLLADLARVEAHIAPAGRPRFSSAIAALVEADETFGIGYGWGGERRRWALHARAEMDSPSARDRTLERLAACAQVLGLSGLSIAPFAFAVELAAPWHGLASVGIDDRSVASVSLTVRKVAFDDVVRLAMRIGASSDIGRRLGALAGAFKAGFASCVELEASKRGGLSLKASVDIVRGRVVEG